MSLPLASKAQTLGQLRDRIVTARIPNMRFFSVEEWQQAPAEVLRLLEQELGAGPLIVRSSCIVEDLPGQSMAGRFRSFANVTHTNLSTAIDSVIESYGAYAPGSEVLVMQMVADPIRSGVVFTHDPYTCSPYVVINWTEGSDTSFVTSGRGGHLWQRALGAPTLPPKVHAPVLDLVRELSELFDHVPLDCEFAVSQGDNAEILWLLQVRPLVLSRPSESVALQTQRLNAVQAQIARGMAAHPHLMGRRTVFGVMPDWNPAEILGIRPRPLALSLYRDVITDSIWAYQRDNYGYRALRSFPLMPNFFGLPYIDVRLSFNSFVPATVNDGLADKLVNYYIDTLLAQPSLHDKVEFDIVLSCYTFDLDSRMSTLRANGFTNVECNALGESLHRLTNRIIDPVDGLWRFDATRVHKLASRRDQLLASSADALGSIYWLIEDAKRYGSLPFAGLARAAFIAVQLLQSLVGVGIFSSADYARFMTSLRTVSRNLVYDQTRLDERSFLRKYGHLRPGTYDILSPRYDAAPSMFFDWSDIRVRPELPEPFECSASQQRLLRDLLHSHRIEMTPSELLSFIRHAIELREWAKFEFTRNVSDSLELIGAFGTAHGFSKEDMSFCDIQDIKELHMSAAHITRQIHMSIEKGKSTYEDGLRLSLPPIITSPEDVWDFEWPEYTPNFITQGSVTASVSRVEDYVDLQGTIVFIPSADPGYDWIFSRGIAGLVTAWGGVNSHMAIRAAELGLPSVIGAGEVLFERWRAASVLHIDCAAGRVEELQ